MYFGGIAFHMDCKEVAFCRRFLNGNDSTATIFMVADCIHEGYHRRRVTVVVSQDGKVAMIHEKRRAVSHSVEDAFPSIITANWNTLGGVSQLVCIAYQ